MDSRFWGEHITRSLLVLHEPQEHFCKCSKTVVFYCVFDVIAYHIKPLIKRGGFGGPGK